MVEAWGLVLAGGPGSRMGGNKPMREIAGRRLIDWVLDAMTQVFPRVIISAAEVEPLAGLGHTVLRDRWPGQGPLNALVTALADSSAPALVVAAVDLPLVRPKVLEMLVNGPEKDKARAPVGPSGWPEPLLAYYHRACLGPATRLLEAGERRTRILLQQVGARIIPAQEVALADPEMLSFVNVNYPDDLSRALELGRSRGLFDTPQ